MILFDIFFSLYRMLSSEEYVRSTRPLLYGQIHSLSPFVPYDYFIAKTFDSILQWQLV